MGQATESCTSLRGKNSSRLDRVNVGKRSSHGKNIDNVYQKQVRDKWHEERNSDITVDQMLGRNSKRKLFPVEENDRYEVNVHSKNDKNILTKLQETSTSADTMAPNFKVTLTQRRQQSTLTGSWMCQLCATPSTHHPDSSEATTGACESESPEDCGGPTGAVQRQRHGRVSDQETAGPHDLEDRSRVHL